MIQASNVPRLPRDNCLSLVPFLGWAAEVPAAAPVSDKLQGSLTAMGPLAKA